MTAIRELDNEIQVFTNKRDIIKKIDNLLSALRPGYEYEPRYQSGATDGRTRFYSTKRMEGGILFIISRGFKERLLKNIKFDSIDIKKDKTLEPEDKKIIKDIVKSLPFKPREYQLKAVLNMIRKSYYLPSMCTGSGKSLVAYITLRYFYEKGLKGILLVPTISLVSQMFGDFKDYQAPEKFLNDIKLIGGENNDKTLNKPLVIGTYQSLVKVREDMKSYDYILTDECLHPDTLIKTERGSIAIKHIKPGDKVYTINEDNENIELKEVVKVHKNLSKESMYEIETDEETIRITGNHKVLTKRGWIRVDTVMEGDDIISYK